MSSEWDFVDDDSFWTPTSQPQSTNTQTANPKPKAYKMNWTDVGLYAQKGAEYGVPTATGVALIADAMNPQDTLARKGINLAGNAVGGGLGYLVGGPVGGAIGALGGGYISDRVADVFDSTGGRISPTELLNAHLENDPIAQQAMYQEKIRQARLMEKEMQRQRMLQYQAQMAQQQGA